MQQHGFPPTKQYVVANECPLKCGKEGAVLVARPPQGSVAIWWSRCQRCLAYWETSPAGKVLVLRGVICLDHCLECLDVKYPDRPHVCATK